MSVPAVHLQPEAAQWVVRRGRALTGAADSLTVRAEGFLGWRRLFVEVGKTAA